MNSPEDRDDQSSVELEEIQTTETSVPTPTLTHARHGAELDTSTDSVRAYLKRIGKVPLLNAEQEVDLAKRIEGGLYAAERLRQSAQDGEEPGTAMWRDLDWISRDGERAKNHLLEANLRLVVSIAKRYNGRGMAFLDLIQEGNLGLIRAVEKFDYARGNKFSTYATWAIMKNFARSIPDEKHHRERYVTGHEEMFEGRPDVRTDEQEIVAQADMARDRVNRLLEGLDPRTREVIRMRNGLDGNAEMTLEQIGQHFGITKERVRQINVRGMKQLRERAQQARVEI
jgi:RNA polymerase sigma factor (sigma-70 family)